MGGLFFLCKIPVLVTLLDKIKRFLKGFSGHFVVIFCHLPTLGLGRTVEVLCIFPFCLVWISLVKTGCGILNNKIMFHSILVVWILQLKIYATYN